MLFLPAIPGNPYLRRAFWMPGEIACFVETQVQGCVVSLSASEPPPHAAQTKEDAKSELRAADPGRKPEAGFENWLRFVGVSNTSCLTPSAEGTENKAFSALPAAGNRGMIESRVLSATRKQSRSGFPATRARAMLRNTAYAQADFWPE